MISKQNWVWTRISSGMCLHITISLSLSYQILFLLFSILFYVVVFGISDYYLLIRVKRNATCWVLPVVVLDVKEINLASSS